MEKLTHWIPFMALVSQGAPLSGNRPLLTRLTEQIIVGIVAAAFAVYTTNVRQEEQIANLNARLIEMQKSQEVLHSRIQETLDRMRSDLYVPKGEKK